MELEAKHIRNKGFYDIADRCTKSFNAWMLENGNLEIIEVKTHAFSSEDGYSMIVTSVIYVITEEMYELELQRKKERDEYKATWEVRND